MRAAPGPRQRYLHSAARFVAEEQIRAFLDGPARGRAVWDLGAGAPPLGRAAAIRTLDRDARAAPTVQADLEAMPFGTGSLEAALSVAVLEHVRSPSRVVEELARVLAPGAPLFVWVPFLHEVHLYPIDLRRFTPYGVRGLLEEHGFVTHECGPGRMAGLATVLAHLYRFLWPPTPPLLPLRLAGHAVIERLRFLDRWAPAPDWPIGTTWLGERRAG